MTTTTTQEHAALTDTGGDTGAPGLESLILDTIILDRWDGGHFEDPDTGRNCNRDEHEWTLLEDLGFHDPAPQDESQISDRDLELMREQATALLAA